MTQKYKTVSLKDWIQELRTTSLKQTKNMLRARKSDVIEFGDWSGVKAGGYCCIGIYGRMCGMSDKAMNGQQQATLEGCDMEFEQPGWLVVHGGTLASLNDDDGYTFAEIATWAEEHINETDSDASHPIEHSDYETL